jgi:hypothetical protein
MLAALRDGFRNDDSGGGMEMRATSPSASANGTFLVRVRFVVIALAWLFAAGGLIQLFLAGLSVFESAKYWNDHADFGHMIGFLTYVLPILALIGRIGARLVAQAFVVTLLFVIQIALANVDDGRVAALHAVNAFLLIGASGSLGSAVLGLVRAGMAQGTTLRT